MRKSWFVVPARTRVRGWLIAAALLASGCASTRTLPGSQLLPPGGDGATIALTRVSRALGAGGAILVVLQREGEADPPHAICFLDRNLVFEPEQDGKLLIEEKNYRFILAGPAYRAVEGVQLRATSSSDLANAEYGRSRLAEAQEELGSPVGSPGTRLGGAAAKTAVGLLFSGSPTLKKKVAREEFERRACLKFLDGTAVGYLGSGGSLTFGVAPGELQLISFIEWPDDPMSYMKEFRLKLRAEAGRSYQVVYTERDGRHWAEVRAR